MFENSLINLLQQRASFENLYLVEFFIGKTYRYPRFHEKRLKIIGIRYADKMEHDFSRNCVEVARNIAEELGLRKKSTKIYRYYHYLFEVEGLSILRLIGSKAFVF